jgi:hypothetical protein
MRRRTFAARRLVRARCAPGTRPTASASGSNRAMHGASTKTGRIGACRRLAEHQKENLRAAKPIWALPPLFAFILHERDLRSFQRATPMHQSATGAFTMPVSTSDRGVHIGLNGLLTIIWLAVHVPLGKRFASLTIATATPAVGFHPKF